MPKSVRDDLALTREQIQGLSSAEALAAFFARLGYPAEARLPMTTEALGLSSDLARAVRNIERLTSVEEGALEIYLFELKSVTVGHTRALARAFRDRAGNYLLVLTDDYQRLDFVLLERVLPEGNGRGIGRKGITLRPRVLTVDRRNPDKVSLRVLRRFTFTEFDPDGEPDPYAQYDKLQSAYVVAEWSEPLFNNRALFSDYYLNQRLPDLPEWDDPTRNQAFREVRGLFADARRRFGGENGVKVRQELIQRLLEALGFGVDPGSGGMEPDFRLFAAAISNLQSPVSFVLAYPWGRYLDGKDETRDAERPEENPVAQVVSLLEAGEAPWAVVTNGKVWRLYSARAHSRATNYYEIDLEETLASPDPGEPFRFFYLLFRVAAFVPTERMVGGETRSLSFLDWLLEESEAYARELGERLKERVFEEIFPHFAEGFIQGLGGPQALLALPEAERAARLDDVFLGTLTFLYRLLFLLYAESRDLLPVREVRGYYEISLQRLKEEIAAQAKTLEDEAPGHLRKAYGAANTVLHDRLVGLFRVIDRGDPARNVPIYNGGLFLTEPDPADIGPEAHNARFLLETRMPDRYLALGLDRLARDVDPKRGDLAFIDYKSLGVRQLGSIYEGLLEFKVRLAEREMAVVRGKKTDEVLPAAEARRKKLSVRHTLPRGAVYLENDRRERKATGSYYTPDYIVKYIVRHTVGPVLDEKFEALRPRLRAAEKRFRDTVGRKQAVEKVMPNRPALLTDIAGDVLRDMFDVKVLDPAMGSGHFLVEAVDYITDRLVRFLDGFPFLSYFFEGMRHAILTEMERQAVIVDPARLTDVTLLKRHVLKRCIYGVDLNPMAVELAKVSLWLDCFTLGAPLSFLDHHLKTGNSLIGGQSIENYIPLDSPRYEEFKRAVSNSLEIIKIADVTPAEVEVSKSLYKEVTRVLAPFKARVHVDVAAHFLGLSPYRATRAGQWAFEQDSSSDDSYEDYREAQQVAGSKEFFHWRLEFPEVFAHQNEHDQRENGGFDAIVGNPPYGDVLDKVTKDYLISIGFPKTGGRAEIYADFITSSLNILAPGSLLSFIIPNTLLDGAQFARLREDLSSRAQLLRVKDYRDLAVFYDATVQTMIITVARAVPTSSYTVEYEFWDTNAERFSSAELLVNVQSDTPWRMRTAVTRRVNSPGLSLALEPEIGTCHDAGVDYKWKGVGWQHRGEKTKISDLLFYEGERRHPDDYPLVKGADIDRYSLDFNDNWLIHDFSKYKTDETVVQVYLDLAIVPVKILTRQTSDRIQACIDRDQRVTAKSIHTTILRSENYEASYIVSILNSKLLSYVYQIQTGEAGRVFAQVKLYDLRQLPIRRIHFVTPEDALHQILDQLIMQYERVEDATLLDEVSTLLPKDRNGSFLAFASGATGAEEKSDVVHDLLAHLAQQMIDLNQHTQAEQKRFFAWLEAALHVQPDRRGRVGLDALTGKTTIFGYLGDYQKDEPKTPWSEIEDVLFKNKRHIGANLNDTRFIARLRAEYEKSLEALRPIKAQLGRTDWLIDQVVYRLYGLTEEEIAVVEGE
jgi:hypothetical protein